MNKAQVLLLLSLICIPYFSYANEDNKPSPETKNLTITGTYVNIEEYGQMFGINIFALRLRHSFGFYGSLKTTGSSVGDPQFDRDVKDAVDPVTSRFKVADFIALGTTWSAPQYFSIYMGIGVAENTGYAELYGPVAKAGEPAFNQTYYVNDDANTASEIYIDGGFLFSYDLLAIQIGRSSLSKTTEFGVGMSMSF
ncbi:MAG: hypothetical protein R8M45_02715 [Ghiorsea sp.]